MEKVENSAQESIVVEIKREPGRPKSPVVEGIPPECQKAVMRLLLIGMKKGYLGKKGEVTIKGVANWAERKGLFLTKERTILSAKTIELRIGELNRELYPKETIEKMKKKRERKTK